jgi:hypothetical protein
VDATGLDVDSKPCLQTGIGTERRAPVRMHNSSVLTLPTIKPAPVLLVSQIEDERARAGF